MLVLQQSLGGQQMRGIQVDKLCHVAQAPAQAVRAALRAWGEGCRGWARACARSVMVEKTCGAAAAAASASAAAGAAAAAAAGAAAERARAHLKVACCLPKAVQTKQAQAVGRGPLLSLPRRRWRLPPLAGCARECGASPPRLAGWAAEQQHAAAAAAAAGAIVVPCSTAPPAGAHHWRGAGWHTRGSRQTVWQAHGS